MLTPIHVLCDCYTKIFRGLNIFQSLLMQSVVMNDLFVWVMPSHSHRVTFGNIEHHLPIGLPEPKTVKIFLQNETVLHWMNVPIQQHVRWWCRFFITRHTLYCGDVLKPLHNKENKLFRTIWAALAIFLGYFVKNLCGKWHMDFTDHIIRYSLYK